MKSIRIISSLNIKGQNVVKGIHMEGLRIVGNPKELTMKYYQDGADEIIYLDVVASLYERLLDFDQLKAVCDDNFIPFTVGGGLKSIKDINIALRAGADKVAINTHAIRNPDFLTEAARNFGAQSVVLFVEAKRIGDNKWEAYIEGGRERTGVDVIEWCKQAVELGAGEILLASIDQEGTRKGYDIDLIKKVASCVNVPVIAHGGCGSPEDMVKVIKTGEIDAVSASSIYQYNDYTISEVKRELRDNKLSIR